MEVPLVIAFVAFLLWILVWFKKSKWAILWSIFFPVWDLGTDILYIISNDFYLPLLFYLHVAATIGEVFVFFWDLWKLGYKSSTLPIVRTLTVDGNFLFWLSCGTNDADCCPFPITRRNNSAFLGISFNNHNDLFSTGVVFLLWIGAVVAQILTIHSGKCSAICPAVGE